jgi:hypothetical protein
MGLMSWWHFWRRKPNILVVMRLDDMLLVHPDQDNSRNCSKCREPVGVYPSGQAVLAQHPDTVILCQICRPLRGPAVLAPGAIDEPSQSHRRSY